MGLPCSDADDPSAATEKAPEVLPAFADPERRLKGTGSRVRHIRIEQAKDLREPYLRELLCEAVIHARGKATNLSETEARPQAIVKAVYPKRRRPAR